MFFHAGRTCQHCLKVCGLQNSKQVSQPHIIFGLFSALFRYFDQSHNFHNFRLHALLQLMLYLIQSMEVKLQRLNKCGIYLRTSQIQKWQRPDLNE